VRETGEQGAELREALGADLRESSFARWSRHRARGRYVPRRAIARLRQRFRLPLAIAPAHRVWSAGAMPCERRMLRDADEKALVADVVGRLRRGELCVLPTETV
jgi:hypothetical protein